MHVFAGNSGCLRQGVTPVSSLGLGLGSGFRCLGFRGLGFRGLGFSV